MKFLGYITDICQYAIHRYDYQFYGIVWISFMLVYGVFKNLSTAMQLGFIKWILLHTKSLWRMWIILCVYMYVLTGQNTVKVISVCILAQNIYAFYRSRFLGRFEIRNLVTRLCLNRDLCDLNTSTWGFRINFVVSTDT